MLQCGRVLDATTVLGDACARARETFRSVIRLEDDDVSLLRGSPLHPSWLNESDSLLFYDLTKTACLLGRATGDGFLISRLPSEHPSLIKWSAPAFVRLDLSSVGLSLGRQTVHSFTACMDSSLRMMLWQEGRRSVRGLEASLRFGGLQHKPDLIALPMTNLKTVGINSTSGSIVDLSFAWGEVVIDEAKQRLVYGPGVTPLQVLHGTVAPPREMQPLYSVLNRVVLTVERVTPPNLTKSSLERMTAGFDPDRRVVLRDGSVLQEGTGEGATKKDK